MLALDLSEYPASYSESKVVLALFNDLTVTVFNAGDYIHFFILKLLGMQNCYFSF